MPNAEPSLSSLGLPRRLTDLLVSQGLLSRDDLSEALKEQHKTGGKLGAILISKGLLTEEQFLSFLGDQCGIRYVSLSEFKFEDNVLELIPESIARQQILIPCRKSEDNVLTVAVADPLNVMVLDDLKMMTGSEISAVLASESEILAAIDKGYHSMSAEDALDEIVHQSDASENATDIALDQDSDTQEVVEDVRGLEKSASDAPVIKMVNLILSNAVKDHASDIHIEAFPKEIRIRYRIDGVLHERPAPPKKFHQALTTRVKIMANLNIAERRVPQDGRIKIKANGKEIDLRVSVLPCAPGEKIVMRILDSSGLKVQMSQLGFEPEALAVFNKCMNAPYGINLITGPTGSGKSTTLYSALANLNTPDTNIITVEDPVEYQLHGINQVQVNPHAGLTFASALRSFLRQDPDIIMVGETRDLETAQIAINAALTGHLVFTTLHTNDAPSSITRLSMMGVEPFLISAAVLMVEAQRLVRSVCPKCKEAYEVDVGSLIKHSIPEEALKPKNGKVTLYKGKGCEHCANTGYRGRLGLYEVLEVTDSIRELILNKAPTSEIKKVGIKQGMLTLRACALRKLLEGATTVEEMIRVTASDIET